LFAFVGFSKAQDWLVLSGYAIHLDHARHCNSFTKGIGVEKVLSENRRLSIGAYDNSNCNTSTYAAAAWTPLHLGSVHLGVIGGLVTGYRVPLLPAGGMVASFERRTWGVNVIGIPPTGASGKGVLWLQAKFPW
jgi:hypothetical protein